MDSNYLIDKYCEARDKKLYRNRVIGYNEWLIDVVSYVFEKQGYEKPENADIKELLLNPVFVSYVGDPDYIQSLDCIRQAAERAMQGNVTITEQDANANVHTIEYFLHYLSAKESDPALASIKDMPIPGLIKTKYGNMILEAAFVHSSVFSSIKPIEKDLPELPLSQRLFNIRLEILYQLQNTRFQSDDWCLQYYAQLKNLLQSLVQKIKAYSSTLNVGDNIEYIDKYAEEESWNCLTPEMISEIRQHVIPVIMSGWGDGSDRDSFNLKMYHIEHALLSEGNLQRVPSNVRAVRTLAKYILDEKALNPRVINLVPELEEFVSDDFWVSPSVSDIESKRSELVRTVYLYDDLDQPITIDEQEDISMSGLLKEGI